MSWSVSAQGRAHLVAAKLRTDFSLIHCMEPEQSIKNSVASIVNTTLMAFPAHEYVSVSASGSQSEEDFNKPTGKKINALAIEIKPMWGMLDYLEAKHAVTAVTTAPDKAPAADASAAI